MNLTRVRVGSVVLSNLIVYLQPHHSIIPQHRNHCTSGGWEGMELMGPGAHGTAHDCHGGDRQGCGGCCTGRGSHPHSLPSCTPISSATRAATVCAATRRGCVHATIRPPSAQPASKRYCGICRGAWRVGISLQWTWRWFESSRAERGVVRAARRDKQG